MNNTFAIIAPLLRSLTIPSVNKKGIKHYHSSVSNIVPILKKTSYLICSVIQMDGDRSQGDLRGEESPTRYT